MASKKDFLQKWMRVDALEKASRKSTTMAKRSLAPAGRGLNETADAPAQAAPAGGGAELAPAPALVPFADMDFWYLSNGMTWAQPQGAKTIHVPLGFVTDFASVPASFWAWMPPVGRYGLPAIVHDWLYWDQSLARSEADGIFHTALSDLGVTGWRKFVLYRSVRWFGAKYWRENKAAKAAGEGRVLKVFPNDARITWSDWRKKPGVFA